MTRRPLLRLVLCLTAVVWTQSAPAQDPQCRLYKVQSSSLNISKEPRGNAVYIDTLDNADVVCVTREQKVGERNWGFVDHKLLKPDQRKPVDGWANLACCNRSRRPRSPRARLGDFAARRSRRAAAAPPAAGRRGDRWRRGGRALQRTADVRSLPREWPLARAIDADRHSAVPADRGSRRSPLEEAMRVLSQVGPKDAVRAGSVLRQESENARCVVNRILTAAPKRSR